MFRKSMYRKIAAISVTLVLKTVQRLQGVQSCTEVASQVVPRPETLYRKTIGDPDNQRPDK